VRRNVSWLLALWLGLVIPAPANAQVGTAVDLPATGQWIDTGIDVEKGDSLGVIAAAPLTGRIGTVRFAVSAKCVAPATGRLFLRINRSGYSGASTTVRVSISHTASTLQASSTAPFVPLPNVVGMRFPAAARSLKALGLAARREKRASSRPAGVVVDQSPEAGVDTREVRVVTLAVSDGSLAESSAPPSRTPRPVAATAKPVESEPIPLPNYVGMRFAAAARAVRDFGLAARRQTRGSGHPKGMVVAQSPAPGVDARKVKAVILAVSDGSLAQTAIAPRTTPPPRRATPAAAPTETHAPIAAAPAAPASAASVPPRETRTSPPAKRPTPAPTRAAAPTPTAASTSSSVAGVQTPKTAAPRPTARPRVRASAAPRSSAKAPAAIAVPPVVGFTQQAAASAVARSSLRAVYRGAEPSNLAPGRVTRTDPVAGATLSRGALVGYWVASGENGVPNVLGRSLDDAKALLQKSGFRLGSVVAHGGAAEPVAAQDPMAGALAPVDSAVNVTTGSPPRGWTWWLLAAGALLVLAALGFSIGNRMRASRRTSRLLTIHSSVELDGPTNFDGDVAMAGPATHLRASVEDGETTFEQSDDIIMREERDGGA
jgi:beta-lactam-binding protein with PASTA domain